MNITTLLIKDSEVSQEQLEEISLFKSIRWKYSLNQQLEWMSLNLHPSDEHLLVYLDEILIAYTNFVNVEVVINDSAIPFMGIGNVCTLESGKGYGDILMKAVNKLITQHNWNAILLCQDNLVPYYEKYDWILVEAYKIIPQTRENILIFNFENKISKLELSNYKF